MDVKPSHQAHNLVYKGGKKQNPSAKGTDPHRNQLHVLLWWEKQNITQVVIKYISSDVDFWWVYVDFIPNDQHPLQSILLPYVFVSWWWHGQYLSRFGSVVIHLPGLSTHTLGRRVTGGAPVSQTELHSFIRITNWIFPCVPLFLLHFLSKAPVHI